MNFGLGITVSREVTKTEVIRELSDDMESYFKSKNYGVDIKNYTIGIVCVSPPFEPFYKKTKPKYTKGPKTINPDGIPFILEDNLEYSIKIDFESFQNAENDTERKKILTQDILSSFSILDTLKKKIKDFNWEQFKQDLETYFKEKNLI